MATQKRRYHPKKWAGVYVYETTEMHNGSPDLCFYINFRSGRRLIWEKVGRISEGYSAEVAAEIRAKRVKAVRHGEEVKTAQEIRREQSEKNRPFRKSATPTLKSKALRSRALSPTKTATRTTCSRCAASVPSPKSRPRSLRSCASP